VAAENNTKSATSYSLLSEHGFAVIDYPPDEQGYEAQTSRELAEQVKQR
jgi:hypothetical protein